jgi:WD40 repeat protein
VSSAATNGSVVIWNLDRAGQARKQTELKHARTVNRLCWHPTEPNQLLSASQDGAIRLWDVRAEPRVARLTFGGRRGHSQPVRDVQFSGLRAWLFAAATDSGTVQVWDVRRSGSSFLVFL